MGNKDTDMSDEDAIMVLKNLLHICEDPAMDRLTSREKKAIKKGIDLLKDMNEKSGK